MLPLIVAGPLLTVTATVRPLEAVGSVIEKDEAPGVLDAIVANGVIVWDSLPTVNEVVTSLAAA